MRRLLVAALLAGCAHAPAPVHFDYSGAHGPSSWGGACRSGRAQSPIDLRSGPASPSPSLAFDYWPAPTRVLDTGHSIQLDSDGASSLSIDGHKYRLVQMHFHHPSEHTLDGKSWPLELHLVHQDAEGKLAVVAVFVGVGEENPWLRPVFADLPPVVGERRAPDARLNAADLLPASHVFFHYDGSLTTPPCTEGVSWIVLQSPITVSQAQFDAFARLYPDNHRPTQALHGRAIQHSDR